MSYYGFCIDFVLIFVSISIIILFLKIKNKHRLMNEHHIVNYIIVNTDMLCNLIYLLWLGILLYFIFNKQIKLHKKTSTRKKWNDVKYIIMFLCLSLRYIYGNSCFHKKICYDMSTLNTVWPTTTTKPTSTREVIPDTPSV